MPHLNSEYPCQPAHLHSLCRSVIIAYRYLKFAESREVTKKTLNRPHRCICELGLLVFESDTRQVYCDESHLTIGLAVQKFIMLHNIY